MKNRPLVPLTPVVGPTVVHMMFSLNVNSIRKQVQVPGKKPPKNAIAVVDIPRYAYDHLGLRALNLSTDLLKGMGRGQIEQIRDNGDKVGCTCLMLAEPDPFTLADPKDEVGIQAIDRMSRVIKAASLLGCNAVSLSIKTPAYKTQEATDDAFDLVAARMKEILEVADAIDINVLIAPMKGLTEDPDKVTSLVKAIGGFRIGTNPDFKTAVESGDPVNYLRRLTPYSTVVNASTQGFVEGEPDDDVMEKADGLVGLDALAAELEAMDNEPAPVHVGYDILPLVGAIKAVGFDGNIALDYQGADDGTLGVLQSRDAIEAALVSIAESS
jgi:Xylose isomerase-like TIM barrel